ncbi:MAG: 3-dehydroquinate synthase [Thermoplasmatales archaeon]|nr:3-dehydroquinate synthase [Thermoplasmatales archaeon]MCW6170180.1 3-dehydroquinate synthase [Thermoplasmatales archaeon]
MSYGIVGNVFSKIDSLHGKKLIFYSRSLKYLSQSITGKNVYAYSLADGEDLKSFNHVISIVKIMMENNLGRNDYVIAIGGGTLTDATGFAASIFKRGVRLINVPTTLLGMIDAAIGGKTAINFLGTKNIVGSFYFPESVWVDLRFLDSLRQDKYKDGIAEMLKYGFIMDPNLLKFMLARRSDLLDRKKMTLRRSILSCMGDKVRIVGEDSLESSNIRITLNYGHTIGHAIEAASNFKVSHGEAISVGMVLEAAFSEQLLELPVNLSVSIKEALELFSLPVSVDVLKTNLDMDLLRNSLYQDKKAEGDCIFLPILQQIGKATVKKIPMKTLEDFLVSSIE